MSNIIRGERPASHFYILNKAISEDKRIGWAARGMLIFLLGKPDNWSVSIQNLINETKDSSHSLGRDGVYRVIKDLISAGYIQRVDRRDEAGKIQSVDYIVREAPLTDYPDTVQPDTANPTLISTESLTSTESTNTLSSKPDDVPQTQKAESRVEVCKRIIDYLNLKTEARFKHASSHLRLIAARLKDGATENEMQRVIDRKCAEWLHKDSMRQYLRPGTLFTPKNYDNYVGQLNQPLPAENKPTAKHSGFSQTDYSVGVDENGYF